MITDGKPFNTSPFFAGGAGMFLQYHDIIKPAYLYAIIKMITTGESYGLPINMISRMSIASIVEWYKQRRYKNPLQQLDWAHKIDQKQLDDLLSSMLVSDPSIYKLSPTLNIDRMIYVYRQQHMTFPIYVYSENEEPTIKTDCESVFGGINFKYLHGDLQKAIKRCEQNFTYIFSDIELVKQASEILVGTCSHVLLARDYRYNYVDNCKTFKYDMQDLMIKHPFIRLGTTTAMDVELLGNAFENISQGG